MANLNKVMLIGRLTRDPEPIGGRTGGTAGAKFGFAVNNRRMNPDTQKWEDIPVFIDMEIWNRGESKQADRVLQTLRKGQQVYVEGHLKMDQWEDKNGGGKRSALRVVVENFQYLEPRGEGEMGEAAPRTYRPAAATMTNRSSAAPPARNGGAYYDDEEPGPGNSSPRGGGSSNNDEDIPF